MFICNWWFSVLYIWHCPLWCVSVVHPGITSPQWLGPMYTNVTYLGAGPFTDFYFICRINHITEQQSSDDIPVFDVMLLFDSQPSSVTMTTTTTTSSLDVIFTSRHVNAGFGTQVTISSLQILRRKYDLFAYLLRFVKNLSPEKLGRNTHIPHLIETYRRSAIMQLPRARDPPHTTSTDAGPSIDACMQPDSF